MRHGDAELRSIDRHRPLSAYGRQQATQLALQHLDDAAEIK